MKDEVTTIGRGTVVRGRVTGAANLEILGRVEGEVDVQGDLVVDARGLAAANLTARRVTIRGAVRGDLVASEAVVLEDGARVVGDIRAPRIAIATGALVRGYVQTGDAAAPAGASRARAQTTAPATTPRSHPNATTAPPPRTQPRPTAPPSVANATRPAPPPVPSQAPSRSPASALASQGNAHAHPATTPAPAAKGPPPPFVPVLKKGAKGAMSKKRA